jgi:radical SAM superfamily enzyme YgiQ (UPF0313 family)
MTKTLDVILCDLVHTWVGAGTYMFPLNVGFIASYAMQHDKDLNIELFKFPEALLQRLAASRPDVVGFSNYIWNVNLNREIARHVRDLYPDCTIVFGGPEATYDDAGIREFFTDNPFCDFFVPFQGEKPFVNILKYLRGEVAKADIEGVFHVDKASGAIIRGKKLDRIPDPDEIDSPYLTGLLDKFFDTNLIPIIETNRGCPFQCTFCAQGLTSYNRVNYFSMDRVTAELDYITSRVKHTPLLHFADANYGIVDRDIEIARYCRGLRERHGYPAKVSSNMAKNRPPAKMIEIARLFGDTAMVISLQSLDDLVLKNVKRSNIKLSKFEEIIDHVNQDQGISGTEIILGLPGETLESHMTTLRRLFEKNVSYIIAYNALILKGTEMDDDRRKGKFKFRTKFRLIDSSFGEYEFPLPQAHNVSGVYLNERVVLEFEEGIRETEAIDESEILSCRPIHWLTQFMWNYRFYYDFLRLVAFHGVNPLDFIIAMSTSTDLQELAGARELFAKFEREAVSEWFDSPEELQRHYAQPDHLAGLKHGEFGKLNGKYIFMALTEYKQVFERCVAGCVSRFPELQPHAAELSAVLAYNASAIIDLQALIDGREIADIEITLPYDVPAWKSGGYAEPLANFRRDSSYVFTIEPADRALLEKLLHQYRHENKNVTLRKMSEYMPIRKLFLTQKSLEHQAAATGDLISIQTGRAGVGQ